jgi:small subunit ribosomal protein S10
MNDVKANEAQNKYIYFVLIHVESHDFKLLDIAVQTIYTCIKEGGIECRPPRPLPTKKVKFTIRRAPSIYKSSFEKFEHRVHSRLLTIKHVQDLDKLHCLSRADIPRAVDVNIKILTLQDILDKKNKRKEYLKQKIALQ